MAATDAAIRGMQCPHVLPLLTVGTEGAAESATAYGENI